MLDTLYFLAWSVCYLVLFTYPHFLDIQIPSQMSPPPGGSKHTPSVSSDSLHSSLPSSKMASSSRAKSISSSSLRHLSTAFHGVLLGRVLGGCKFKPHWHTDTTAEGRAPWAGRCLSLLSQSLAMLE